MMNTIHLAQSEAVSTVTLSRPAVHNAMNPEMIAELTAVFDRLGQDPGVRVIVLAGAGKSFCAGADVEYMRAAAGFGEAENVADARRLAALFGAIQTCPKPVIARVQGAALGGGAGLVAAADCAVAAEDARFGFTEAALGIMPAVISPYVLGKLVPGAVRELFLTGERFGAQRAREIGLVHRIARSDGLDSAVAERVEKFLAAGPAAQAAIKRLWQQVLFKTPPDVLDLTAHAIAERRASEEGQEGLKAFLEKRPAAWKNVP